MQTEDQHQLISLSSWAMRPLSATFAFVCRSRFSKPFQAIAGENQVEAAEYDSLRYMETLIVETDGHFQNTIPINSIFTGSKLTKICLLLMSFMNSSNSRRSRTNIQEEFFIGNRTISRLWKLKTGQTSSTTTSQYDDDIIRTTMTRSLCRNHSISQKIFRDFVS